jgi:hypothetical protein
MVTPDMVFNIIEGAMLVVLLVVFPHQHSD